MLEQYQNKAYSHKPQYGEHQRLWVHDLLLPFPSHTRDSHYVQVG